MLFSVIPVPDICLGNTASGFLEYQLRALGADFGIRRNGFCYKGISSDDTVFANYRFAAENG